MKAGRRREAMLILSQKLRQVMAAQGISQIDLADRSGLATKTIGNVLHGTHVARSATINALAGALGVKTSQLIDAPVNGESANFHLLPLTADEALLLGSYRSSSRDARRALIGLAQVLASRSGQKKKRLNGSIRSLQTGAIFPQMPDRAGPTN